MRSRIKRVLVLGALLLVGVGCEVQPTLYHYRGFVEDLRGPRTSYGCWDLVLVKEDGSISVFSLNGFPPTWKGMHGEILLREEGMCGYTMVSAKEDK